MTEAVQARTLKTRARLVDAAKEVIAETGYGALRVEEVVRRAKVAKGTFFAHFSDKDALMDRLIGAQIDIFLDELEAHATPNSPSKITEALLPLMGFMTCERYVFDVILRYSGAAAREEVGPIAMTFERFLKVVSDWIAKGPFRQDAAPDILAEGVQSFAVNAMALHFCALHSDMTVQDRLTPYLELWLLPPSPLA